MTDIEKIKADIEEQKIAIADPDVPVELKEKLEKALANTEKKLEMMEAEEKKRLAEEKKKAKVKERKPRNPKMQIKIGDKNLDDASYDEILAKYNERRNTAKGQEVKIKTKSAFTIIASATEQPPAENLEANK